MAGKKRIRYWRVTHAPKGATFIEKGWQEARIVAYNKKQAEGLVRDTFKDKILWSDEIKGKKEIAELKKKIKRLM